MPFSQKILAWYGEHRRNLPWRQISDPYKIWVSEIILQQTRVIQGYDYYLRFIGAFPNVEALANASEDDALRLWQGLGYYSRCRNLCTAARQIVSLGKFPDTYEGVRALKGVGDYTAAAICSFAYDLPCAVVDGNVYRVLSRHFGMDAPIDTAKGKKLFASLAQELLPSQHVSDYNQGLMDFGALQCVPASPKCHQCPLADTCAAFATGLVQELPVKKNRTKVRERFFAYVQVRTPEGIWIKRRKGGDIWQGLYEYPLLEFDHRPDFTEIASHPFVKSLPPDGRWKQVAENLKHVLSHRVIWADAYTLTFDHALPAPEGYLPVPATALGNYGMPQLLLRIAWDN